MITCSCSGAPTCVKSTLSGLLTRMKSNKDELYSVTYAGLVISWCRLNCVINDPIVSFILLLSWLILKSPVKIILWLQFRGRSIECSIFLQVCRSLVGRIYNVPYKYFFFLLFSFISNHIHSRLSTCRSGLIKQLTVLLTYIRWHHHILY